MRVLGLERSLKRLPIKMAREIFERLPIEMKRVLPELLPMETDRIEPSVISPVERLPWHILPPGEHPFPAILEHLRALSQRNPTVEYDHTRLEKLNSLGPTSIYIGVEEFDGYFVFCFQQYSAAVLDCPRVGNAIYLMRESDWKTLCRLTKAELLARHHAGVRRIVHSHRWFERLKACLIPLSKSQPR